MERTTFTVASLSRGPLRRLVFIGGLLIALMVPLAPFREMLDSRWLDQRHAVDQVAQRWGAAQTLIGPVLVVPFQKGTGVHSASFLPREFHVQSTLEVLPQSVGFHQVPGYRNHLLLKGVMDSPDLSAWDIQPESILWNQAHLWLRVSDVHVLRQQTRLNWNGTELAFQPGTGPFGPDESGIHVPLRSVLGTAGSHEFRFELVLDGSDRFDIVPVGDTTTLQIRSSWKAPRFLGAWMPLNSKQGPAGFEADWTVSALGRDFPNRWLGVQGNINKNLQASGIGVELVRSADVYRLAQDSVPYQVLFLLIPLLVLWGFETRLRVAVHSLHYGLVGCAMVLFYWLQLALAEVFGFAPGYAAAALAVVMLVGGHCFGVLGSWRRGLMVSGCLGLMYGYLYFALIYREGTLLASSIGLFFLLALVMALTQKLQAADPFAATAETFAATAEPRSEAAEELPGRPA